VAATARRANQRIRVERPLLDQKIVRQEGLVTIWDLPDILLSRRDGLPLSYVFPTAGRR